MQAQGNSRSFCFLDQYSTGQRQDPGKFLKKKKGISAKFRTILNLEVIKSDLENGLLYLKGSIPGSKNSIVFLRKSIKSFNRKTSTEKFKQETKETSKKETKSDIKKPENKKIEDKKSQTKEQTKKK